ncbi:MAG TPA: hypothetical protein VHU81_05265, partial [Thermoanaerobaculia bacterium]|nr:hypothetical protein [Thermoanaerobaculia bacterium]
MVPELRRAFNSRFTEETYRAKVQSLEAEAGHPIDFRICETPVFLDEALTRDLVQAVEEIVDVVISPAYLEESDRAVPARLAVPGDEKHTVFLQIDFALVEGEDGRYLPQLIELQGFPSVYAFQWLLDRGTRRFHEIPAGFTTYFNGLDEDGYAACLYDVIVGDCDPENVVLLEIDPLQQKTRVDFSVTERLLGIPTVDALAVKERGGRLYYRNAQRREVPIQRLYNRVILDEVERKGL